MLRIVFLIWMTFLPCLLWAQPREGGVLVKGNVVDNSNELIPYASVALFKANDSSLVEGVVTDELGNFEIRTRPGNYYLQINFLSYQEYKQSITVTPGKGVVDLGKIALVTDAKTLDEFVIEGEQQVMELKLDKRVYNVDKDLSNVGSNASEVLDNVPSVTVDVEGNVSLRGSGNVRILIDGKQSGLVRNGDPNSLRNLQGNLIEKIEVITNPSARYDAEGEVGIINIVLKKNKKSGVNGTFNLSTGWPHNHNFSFDINYRHKKVNLFASAGVGYRYTPGYGLTYREVQVKDSTFIFESDRDHNRGGVNTNYRLGADFLLNDKNTITLSGMYRYSIGNNNAKVVYTDLNEVGDVLQLSQRLDDEIEETTNIETTLQYRKTFEKKGQELIMVATYNESDDTENSDYIEENLTYDFEPLIQRSSNTEDERNIILQTDYIHPLGKEGKFETGVKASMREIENDFGVDNLVDNDWIPFSTFNNQLIYNENIYAAYAMAGNKSGKFSYQLGVRSEYSDIKTQLLETNEINPRSYNNFFPSAHFTYDLASKNAVQWSYSRRINRPRFRHLLPFYGFSDSRSFFSGNPDLNPEYINSLEVGHMKNWETGSLLSNVYYRYKTDVIERITSVDSTGLVRTLPVNLAVENAYGIEFTFSKSIKNWWRWNGNFNFFRAIRSGDYLGQQYSADTYSWTSRVTSKMKIKPGNFDFQASINYRGPAITTQGRSKAMYNIDLGVSKDIMHDNATISFTGKDIFNTRVRRSISEGDDFYSESEFQWRSRQFMLNFSYRLNRKKSRPGRGDYDGDDD